MKVRKVAAFAAFGLLLATGAQAADLPQRIEAPAPYAPPVFTWTGFYAGAHVGYSWGRDQTTEFFTATGAFTGLFWKYPANTVLGGLHVGYGHQIGSLVLGVEADADLANARGGFTDPTNLAVGNPGGAGTLRNAWRASIRGKLGYAAGRFMPFVTGGVAFANLKYIYTNPLTGIEEKTESVRTGYTVGAGVSYAFTNQWRATLEYRYTDFGAFRYASQTAFPGLLTGRQQPRFSTVKAGISYKF
ncbi:MAG: porin family protein [Hyphomicrobiales bacterium]|nr:porin family protein [Hyphomicrobiales bacterium]